MTPRERFDQAIARFDAANAEDPEPRARRRSRAAEGAALCRAPHGDARAHRSRRIRGSAARGALPASAALEDTARRISDDASRLLSMARAVARLPRRSRQRDPDRCRLRRRDDCARQLADAKGGAQDRRRRAGARGCRRARVPRKLPRRLRRRASRLRRSEARRHPDEDREKDVGARARGGARRDCASRQRSRPSFAAR